jgi:hypothetical protein
MLKADMNQVQRSYNHIPAPNARNNLLNFFGRAPACFQAMATPLK